jgi:PKD repeat protein
MIGCYKISKLVARISSFGIIICFFLLLYSSAVAQEWIGENKIYLIGQVTNELNGAPIKEHQITISSDSTYNPGFIYHNLLYTDSEGYFYDTIPTSINKGALLISTDDYLNNQHDTTVYFRFTWSDINVLFANFVLPTEPPQVYYQANFYYYRNPFGQNPSEYQFYDLTNSCNILSYLWDFGDQTYSTESNPLHAYNQSGIYRVMITVYIQAEPNVDPIISSIVKVINVTIKSYFYLGGHVMAGFFPIDYGEAFLYKFENNELVPIDTAVFNDTLGFYLFYQVIEGEYIVKADLCPNSIHFNHFMTTYYSNKTEWTDADTLFHYGNNCEYDIELKPVTQSFNGEGLISGTIIYGFDSKKGYGFPAENVEIILMNDNLEPLLCSHSSENGAFSFESLDLSEYYVHAEVTGKYTYPLKVCLTESNSEINEITLTIGSYSVNGNVNAIIDSNLEGIIGQPFPNPASDFLFIRLNNNISPEISVSLFNITGQIIEVPEQIESQGISYLVFEIADINPGIYFLRIGLDSQAVIRKFVKK